MCACPQEKGLDHLLAVIMDVCGSYDDIHARKLLGSVHAGKDPRLPLLQGTDDIRGADRNPPSQGCLFAPPHTELFFKLRRSDAFQTGKDLAGMAGIDPQIIQAVHDTFKKDAPASDQHIASGLNGAPVHVWFEQLRLFDHHVDAQMRVDDLIRRGDALGFRNGHGADGVPCRLVALADRIGQREGAQRPVVAAQIKAIINGVAERHGPGYALGVPRIHRHVEDDAAHGIAEQVPVAERHACAEQSLHQVAFDHGPADKVGQVMHLVPVAVIQVGVYDGAWDLAHQGKGHETVDSTFPLQFYAGIFIGKIVGYVPD